MDSQVSREECRMGTRELAASLPCYSNPLFSTDRLTGPFQRWTFLLLALKLLPGVGQDVAY